jgi:hypothetical protein
MLPYFTKRETRANRGESLHGRPDPAQRHRRADWTGFVGAIVQKTADMHI